MLDFEPCSVALLKRMAPFFRGLSVRSSDLSMGMIWMWRGEQEPQICVRNDTMVLRQIMNGYPAYTWPIGPDVDGMLDALLQQVREEDIALRFFSMEEETVQQLLGDPRFDGTMWGYDRRWSDYLYSFDRLCAMDGGELSKIRNRINHFVHLYGEPEIRALLPEHLPQATALLDAYAGEHTDMDKLEKAELRHSRELLSVCHALGLPAAGLWIEGALAGFSIGEIVGETLIIHVEKALVRYEDIYPVILQGFARYVRRCCPRPLKYLNREDDSGDAGLREAKNAYHPIAIAHKYQAHVHTPGAKVAEYPVLQTGKGIVLTAFRETDKEAYFRLNTDRENNLWWGYDYEEDYTVPGHPDEETFYTSVMFDMAVGDSMNFAVREQEDGPMIGEGLLWNFTDAGSAEVGMRLLPEYQGKGISAIAGPALIRYAEKGLGMTTRAKCRNSPDNGNAIYSAIAAGFRERRRDDTWIYLDRVKE